MVNIDISNIVSPQKIARQLAMAMADSGIDSLPEYTSSTRLNPIVLVDRSITILPDDVQQNLMQTLSSIYAAHYLQAVAVSVNVMGVNTISLLDKFSTDRDTGRILARTAANVAGNVAMESMDLPTFTLSMEDYSQKELNEQVNLAVGRLLHVKVGVGDQTTTIPVSLILNPKIVDGGSIPRVLAMTSEDTSISGRWHKWRSGEIESFVDYLFGLDLVEKDRKALINDEADIYKTARTRRFKSIIDQVVSGGAKSVNTASTMAIITQAAAEELEVALKGKLKSGRTRMEYFRTTHSMLLCVVDSRKERLTIYQRGIDNYGTYTFSDIQKHGSNAGAMDINAILKAYKLGEAPSL